jgi:flagella basal body P-ring formation protein FlgA
MSKKAIWIITIACLLASAVGGASDETTDSGLRIYLPREIVIEDNIPRLGEIGIIRGDESLAAKAGEIVLGRISAPGQEITVDRRMLLSRLACNGIPASKVKLSGAERVKVRQKWRTIQAEEFVELAKLFLSKNLRTSPLGASSICQSDIVRAPDDLNLAGVHTDIKLVPCIVRSGAVNQTRIRVGVVAGGKEIGSREIRFGHKYEGHKAVALSEIPAGGVISRENVKVEKTISSYPEVANWSSPYGLIARRRIPKDAVVHANIVGPAKPVILVKRNQNVVIRIQAGGLVITATGRMVDEGAAGDFVRVRNVDSQRVIIAKVNEDGTVGPVL